MNSLGLRLLASLTVAACIGANVQAQSDRQMLPTRDAFSKYQFTTKRGFVQYLRETPGTLRPLAKHFKVSPEAFVKYVEDNLSLQRLGSSATYTCWCLRPNGTIYSIRKTYEAGMPVWATPDGTPVLRWVCTNPMQASLPRISMPAAMIVPREIVVPREEVKVEEKVEIKEEVKVEEKVEVKEEIKVEEKVEVKVEEKVVVKEETKVETKEEVVVIEEVSNTVKPWSIYVGGLDYRAKNRDDDRRHLAGLIGANYEFYQRDAWRLGLYAETAGTLQKGAPYQFTGGGLSARYLFGREWSSGWTPYLGAGLGYYRVEYEDGFEGHVNRLGGKLGLGIENANGFFVEAGHWWLGRRSGLNFDRFGLSLGWRF